jgi:hypothetical protein
MTRTIDGIVAIPSWLPLPSSGWPTVSCRFGVQFLIGMATTFSMGVFSTQ